MAAKQIFLSQPTISTHIKQLNRTGVQLLVRSTKDVILSDAGVIFYPFAMRLLETESEALAQIHKNEMEIKGTVSISYVFRFPAIISFRSFLRIQGRHTRISITGYPKGTAPRYCSQSYILRQI